MSKISGFTKLLIKFSGAKIDLIEETPSETGKYAGIGATILLTGIFAFISSTYAIYRVFHIDSKGNYDANAIYYAVAFGLVWGLMIFNLDRYIVLSMKKQANKWRELGLATPRIIIAILISIVVALPLEIKIFENRILKQIVTNSKNSSNEYVGYSKEQFDISNKNIAKKEQALNDAYFSLNTEPKDIKDLRAVYDNCRNAYKALYSKNMREIRTCKSKINNINKTIKQKEESGSPNVNITKLKSEIRKLNNRVNSLNNASSRKSKECQKIKTQIDIAIKEHRDETKELIASLKEQQEFARKRQIETENQYQADTSYISKVNKVSFSPTFITQVEAYYMLIENNKKEGNYSLWYISVFIMLLFLAIETSPIFVKIISSKGSYDEILALRKNTEVEMSIIRHRKELESMNYKFDTELAIAKQEVDENKNTKESFNKSINITKQDYYEKVKKNNLELNNLFFETITEVRKQKTNTLIEEYTDNENQTYSEIVNCYLKDIADNTNVLTNKNEEKDNIDVETSKSKQDKTDKEKKIINTVKKFFAEKSVTLIIASLSTVEATTLGIILNKEAFALITIPFYFAQMFIYKKFMQKSDTVSS